jgi:hypothetical protein
LDFIITRDTKDFVHSIVPAITPADFLKQNQMKNSPPLPEPANHPQRYTAHPMQLVDAGVYLWHFAWAAG